MSHALYSGSFDPITLGHVDILRRIRPLYDKLTILVAQAENKEYLFTPEERVSLIKESVDFQVDVSCDSGLVVNYAKKVGAQVIIRGIRGVGDMEHEKAMAQINKKLAPELETLIVFASEEYSAVSSRLVKEVVKGGGDLSFMVTDVVEKALKRKLLL